MDILTKILELLKENNKKQKDLCDYLDISSNVFTNWKSGLNSSYNRYLPQIAEYFNVSVDYLVGNTDKKEKPLPKQGLYKNMKTIVELYDKLSPENQALALQMLSLLEIKQKNGENE